MRARKSGRQLGDIRHRLMESDYSFDTQENLVQFKVRGEVTVDEAIDLLDRATADPRFVPAMGAVLDYREAHGSWDYTEIQRMRDYLLRFPVRRGVRWAAVLKPGELAATGHLLILISEAVDAPLKMNIFEEPERALRWVRGEID
jgi:hypothetical protein